MMRRIACSALLLGCLSLAACNPFDGSSDNSTETPSDDNDGPDTGGGDDDGANDEDGSDDGAEDENSGDNGTEDDGGSDDGTEDEDRQVTLSWTAPEERVNGMPISLSELELYEVHYGPEPHDPDDGNVFQEHTLDTEVTIDELPEGTYYFVVRVSDTDGLWSDFSQEKSATID